MALERCGLGELTAHARAVPQLHAPRRATLRLALLPALANLPAGGSPWDDFSSLLAGRHRRSDQAYEAETSAASMVPPSSSVDPVAGDVATLDDIMHRYSTGDGSLFRALYEALAPRIFRFCLRLSRRRNEAEDLLQDTFLRLHRARATYEAGAPVVPWAFAIARSAYLDQARRRRRRPEGALSETGAPAEQLNLKCDAPADSAANVRALQQVIERELERLSEKNRSAYVLLIEEGLSVAEAAAVLGVSNDAVKQRAHRAYDQIRAAVRRAGWDGDL